MNSTVGAALSGVHEAAANTELDLPKGRLETGQRSEQASNHSGKR